MKLYSLPLSPFAARVRLAIYRKGLSQIEIISPPEDGLKSAAFLALNPMGRIPTLVLDSGVAIPESATIIEYLEDAFPEVSLRPHDPAELARARLFLRLPDIYFENSPRILFGMRNPADRNKEVVDNAMAALHRGLAYINHYIQPRPWAVADCPSIADCAIVPVLNVVSRLAALYDEPAILRQFPNVNAYWGHATRDPINAQVIAEQSAAVPR